MKFPVAALFAIAFSPGILAAENPAPTVPLPEFHLTARPWKPLNISRDAYLDSVEGLCNYLAKHQVDNGAIVDPFVKRETQYSTPYFAASVAALMRMNRGRELWNQGIRAMDHATACFAKGDKGIPDRHGEFFDASLAEALEWYDGHAPADKINLWRGRMQTARDELIQGPNNNWRTYAMRGEWLRAQSGLIDRPDAMGFISNSWWHATQRDRIASAPWNLYHDGGTDPESLAVEPGGRVNLLGLIRAGYDGVARNEIEECTARGTCAALLLQDPSGQCPPNGRADNHVWNDVLYQLGFEMMAERAESDGQTFLAGQYRRAALLSFRSINRWHRTDAEWAGSFYVTKNRFDPAERVGYQAASIYANYNAAVALHLAECGLARKSEIAEVRTPVEEGGYAIATDDAFATAVANAGGMQMLAALRGDTNEVYGHYWTALGVERIGRADWDTRLGPSDGVRDSKTGLGITFAPTWLDNGHWVKMADVPDQYQGRFSVQFTHPLLVRCAIDYSPLPGKSGPTFRQEFILTPDGVLATLRADGAKEFGVTWPLLENDGFPLTVAIKEHIATTAYDPKGDQQCFISLNSTNAPEVAGESLLSSYGWLKPVRVVEDGGMDRSFIYPRNSGDPQASAVRESFHFTPAGFQSVLGRVSGNIYIGRTSAGGEGAELDCDGDGKPDVVFKVSCRFILQLRAGNVTAVEADRENEVRIQGRNYHVQRFVPVEIK